jgi:transposase-like protein
MKATANHTEACSMGRRSNCASKVKAEIVLSVLTKQVTAAEACRSHGIPRRRWPGGENWPSRES